MQRSIAAVGRAWGRPTGTQRPAAEVGQARLSRRASTALVLVFVALGAFMIASSQGGGRATERAVAAGRLTDDFAAAAFALRGQESLEQTYHLSPSPAVEAAFQAEVAVFGAALGRAEVDGGPADRALVADVLRRHARYVDATLLMFRAVDGRAVEEADRLDAAEADPLYAALSRDVVAAARTRHERSLEQLAQLHHEESAEPRRAALVLVVGLALAGLLASVSRGHLRVLDAERARAVHDSLHDALTGLPNRRLLADRFALALRPDRRSATRTGLLLLDLDRFKEVNDTFGHACGDALLIDVGARLVAALRDDDTVSRLGGDEFAVLLTEVHGVPEALEVAQSLRAVLELPFRVDGVDLQVAVSIGVVVSGEHGQDAATLLQHADAAMYVAKTRDIGVTAYDAATDGSRPAGLVLLGDLRRGLQQDELVLHHQPKVDLRTGQLVGVEALVRWQHPGGGLEMPHDFVPLAERSGLVGDLTRHVLELALAQSRAWLDAGRPLPTAVKLSAHDLLDALLPAQVAGLLDQHGVPPELLVLEVTQSAAVAEPVRAEALLRELAALGVRTSLDHVGAVWSGAGQLSALPVGELKIDGAFVRTLRDATSAAVVRGVIDLGHDLGMTLVAESVESSDVLEVLVGYGCDVAQGHHLGRPVPAAELDAWRAVRQLPRQVGVAGA